MMSMPWQLHLQLCVATVVAGRHFYSGFDGLILSAGASGTLTFDLPVEKLVVADANGKCFYWSG